MVPNKHVLVSGYFLNVQNIGFLVESIFESVQPGHARLAAVSQQATVWGRKQLMFPKQLHTHAQPDRKLVKSQSDFCKTQNACR